MTTRLDSPLKREINVGGAPYTLTISPDGLKLVPKGRRKGYELSWQALVSGDEALAVALNASVANAPAEAADGDASE
jgi:hypothetical protein